MASRTCSLPDKNVGSVDDHWTCKEIDPAAFADARLGHRVGELLRRLGNCMGSSIPLACQDWANTKAAYRFLANTRVDEADILSGHFAATRERFAASQGPILLLQDTTEFVFQRSSPAAIGITKSVNSGRDKNGRLRRHTLCGILMHTNLAVTVAGLPLGLSAAKVWTRAKFKGTTALKRRINPTRVPIEKKESVRWLDNLRQSIDRLGEPDRCIHVGGRESDIYELFCLNQELGTHFLVHTCVDRLAGDGGHTIAAEMAETRVKRLHRVDVRDDKGEVSRVTLEILPPRHRAAAGRQTETLSLPRTDCSARDRAGRPQRP